MTTPHELQEEARSREGAQRRPVDPRPHKPTAKTCPLDAVVSQRKAGALANRGSGSIFELGEGREVWLGLRPAERGALNAVAKEA